MRITDDIETVRKQFIAEAKATAEALRLMIITPGAGKAMAYAAKRAEAQAVINDGQVGHYIAKECERLRLSADTVAQMILKKAEATDVALAEIERVELATTTKMKNAKSIKEIYEAKRSAGWDRIQL